MSFECPHGNSPGERCAVCIADGRRQPGDHNQRRYTDPDRVSKQTAADDHIAATARRQADRRREVDVARTAAAWSRTQPQIDDEADPATPAGWEK